MNNKKKKEGSECSRNTFKS